jgi:hypothetical protein
MDFAKVTQNGLCRRVLSPIRREGLHGSDSRGCEKTGMSQRELQAPCSE